MNWQPPQWPAPQVPADSAPAPRKPGSGRVVAIVAALVVLVGVGVFVVTRDNDEPKQSTGEETVGVIGPDGGLVTIPDSDAIGGGITMLVPAGALAADTQVTISASPGRSGEILGLADEDAEVWSALANYAVDYDTLLHPVFGPLVLASLTEFTGPVIDFGPNALALGQSAVVSVPLDLLDFPEGTLPVVLMESVTGWEVLDSATIDRVNGVLLFQVPHFSRSFIGRIFGNLWSNPSASTLPGQYTQALETLAAGPVERVTDGVMRAVLCSTTTPNFNAAVLPSAGTLFDYLGFETTRVSNAPAGALTRIEDALKAHFTAAGSTSTTGPHDFTLEMLIQLAMTETGGDPFQALVLAHDVLRDNRNAPSIQNVMENVRGDNGDERGARYHLLGTAIYAFAYQHFRATDQLGTFWPPRPETVTRWEEAWVSGDIQTDTVEYAVDRLGAQLGRDLYTEYATVTAGGQSDTRDLLCASATTTTTSSTTPTSTVPPDVVLGSGDVQATLIWSGDSDMDLHVVEPNGEETMYSSKESSSGGQLDHDDIPSCGIETGSHVENIFWPVDQAPPGEYIVYVQFYNACVEGSSQSVQLTVRVDGVVVISEAITLVDDGLSTMYTFNVT